MNIEQRLKVLKNERECIKRQCHKECDRQCGQCDLCLTDEDILAVYDFLIEGYEVLLSPETVTFTAKIKSVDGIDKIQGEDKSQWEI